MGISSENKNSSTWSPLLYPVFKMIWLAAIFSNIGTWMQNVGESWLMTTLTDNPFLIALVQSISALPIFLFALPAGALADILNRRTYLIFLQSCMCVIAGILALMTYFHLISPVLLLVMTFILGIFTALSGPTWLTLIPELIPKEVVPSAIILNGVGINVARVVGPAIAGIIIATIGTAAVFAINSLSFLGIIFALRKWHEEPILSSLPAERFFGAMRNSLRYALNSPIFHNILIRTFCFFIFSSAVLALLPLLVRQELARGPKSYGLLLGLFGLGAILAMLLIPMLRKKLNYDQLICVGSVVFSITGLTLSLGKYFYLSCGAMIIGGAAWLIVLSTFNTAVLSASPSWVRARTSSLYLAILSAGMVAGGALWGAIATQFSISFSLMTSAFGLIATTGLAFVFSLKKISTMDLTPLSYLPSPPILDESRYEQGPVMVMIEYVVFAEQQDSFTKTMREMRQIRLSYGAFFWNLFIDPDNLERIIECFMVESWVEHLRQHQRTSSYDQQIKLKINDLHRGEKPPKVTHIVTYKF